MVVQSIYKGDSCKFYCTNVFRANRAQFGGGLYADKSSLKFPGDNTFNADGSNLNFSANLTISSNAVQVGGGIYSDNSTMNSNGCTVVERNVMAEGSS